MESTKVQFDLNKVMFEAIDGTKTPILEVAANFGKEIAEHFYYKTSNLALKVFAMDLYKSPSVEVDRVQLMSIKDELPNLKLFNPTLQSFDQLINSCLAELDKKV